MPAYVVVEVTVTDPEAAARYRELSGASVANHGGRFLARGGRTVRLESDWDPERVVIIEFPSVEAAERWYASPDYAAAREVRAGAGEWRMIVVEGV